MDIVDTSLEMCIANMFSEWFHAKVVFLDARSMLTFYTYTDANNFKGGKFVAFLGFFFLSKNLNLVSVEGTVVFFCLR